MKIVITAAAAGIGAGIARVAARDGAAVTIVDIADEPGNRLVKEIQKAGGEALYIHCDVTDYAQLEQAIDRSATHFGGIDTLVNNVGLFDNVIHPAPSIKTMDETHFRRILEINVVSHWMAAKFATPYLRESANASILQAGSIASFLGYPGGPLYGATKGGVAQLTKHLAVELAADRIRVNCYCPGAIRTEGSMRFLEQAGEKAFLQTLTGPNLVPRIGEPEDVGNLVCFLASDRASFINGVVYLVDGGALAWRGTLDLLGIAPESFLS
ncbi:SDR family NAD(P)-dependent oxidoreductase [Flavisphingomonas formosensis]|uniref:SDR family NAD(P)-dependent oxidoreductase n=1 Tax=Flavisphingomonas formosensis TaxID=861534 RepID=UPI0012FC56D9|nr:SDR family oxidoreductase [Sphingomonas formosensis]